MRVAGNGDVVLAVNLGNDALDSVIRVKESFYIRGQSMIRFRGSEIPHG